MATSGMMIVLKDGTVLRDREAFLHKTTEGSFVWSFFETEVVSTFRGTTKREWLDRWDAFIGEKIRCGWHCESVGVNPYWRGKVGKLSSLFKTDS
jgi:hypothetical protein